MVMMPSMPSDLAERILRDCRGAIGEVRFGFGSKRQVWAFEDRHQLDAAALAEELAARDPAAFLELAVAFHDDFAEVSNAWRVRDRIQALTMQLAAAGDPAILAQASSALVDDHLAVRHWLVAALLAGPSPAVFRALEDALARAYLPQDRWALLARLASLAETHACTFGDSTVQALATLAQFSARPEDRLRALDFLARFGGRSAAPTLVRAARADADPTVRAQATALEANSGR